MENVLVNHVHNFFLVGGHDGNSSLDGSGHFLGDRLESVIDLGRSASTLGLAAATVSLTLACASRLVAAARGLGNGYADAFSDSVPDNIGLGLVVNALSFNK